MKVHCLTFVSPLTKLDTKYSSFKCKLYWSMRPQVFKYFLLFLELLHRGTIRTKYDNGLPQLSQLEPIDLSVALIPNCYNPLVCVLKLLKKLEV
uniref:Uncharacterized protein n=1 Tax=Gossypium raimondii TaxID=29730 RepID=A0A0D2PEY4_GOSRA|nr:hypothetical protein B456_007G258500 [Gossypium raimondii]